MTSASGILKSGAYLHCQNSTPAPEQYTDSHLGHASLALVAVGCVDPGAVRVGARLTGGLLPMIAHERSLISLGLKPGPQVARRLTMKSSNSDQRIHSRAVRLRFQRSRELQISVEAAA